MSNNKVSIVTPSYNTSSFILETYQSIKEQTIQNWEWIIIDDNSSDNSWDVIESMMQNDHRVIGIKNNENRGPGPSRNSGIEKAQGKYLTFIDSDDLWMNDFLEKSIDLLNEKNVYFSFASYERWNDDFTSKFDDFIVPEKLDYKTLLLTCPISCLTAFIDIEKLGKKYMSDLPKRQDYGLWLDYLKVTDFAYGIKEPLAKYRIRKNSLSASKMKVVKYQFLVYFKHQKLNLFKSLYYTCSWAYFGFKKYKGINR